MNLPKPQSYLPSALLAILLLVALAAPVVLAAGDAEIHDRAEAQHLARVFAYAEYLAHQGPDPSPDQPVHWPPTFSRLAARFWLATGYSPMAPALLWSLFWALLLLAVYLLGKELADAWTGLLAATLAAGSAPLVYYARLVTLDLPLAMAVAWAMLCLVQSQGLRRVAPAVFFGIAAAVACLAKGYAPVYLLPPALIALLLGGPVADWNKRGYHNPVFNAAVAGAFAALVISWWYSGRIGELAVTLGDELVAGPNMNLAQTDFAWFLVAAGVLLFLGLALAWPHRRTLRVLTELSVWVMVPAILFTGAPARFAQLMLPVFPAVAVLAAVGLSLLPLERLRRGITVVLATLALLSFVVFLFSPAVSPAPWRDGEAPATLPDIARTALAESPLVVVGAAGGQPPARTLGYLMRVAQPETPLPVTDLDVDHETVVAEVLDQLLSVRTVLLLTRDGLPAEFAADFSAFAPAEQAPWSIAGQKVTLEIWRRKD